ncbi:MAG: sulfite exporter TauE/SafE family protein [Succinivibrionaceae bacterium]|nr:sulfite exporter TauE/SafE family protein [Succinivibrionaceae bacterium]
MNDIILHFTLFMAGFIANVLASLSGGGAGFVQLPVLIFMGLNFPVALGTHKVAVVALGAGALARNHRIHDINWQIGSLMLLVGCPAVVAGSLIVVNVSDFWAELILGLITCASVIYSIFKKNFGENNVDHHFTPKEMFFGSILIALVGLLSGSFSSGAGLFAIMVLVLYFKLSIKTAIFHSMIFVAFIWNFIGAFTVGAVAAIEWAWVPALLSGAFIGGYTGTLMIKRFKNRAIKKLFQTVMFISGVLLLIKAAMIY